MSKRILISLGSLLVALATASGAWAYLAVHGAGSGSASVGSLNAPAKPSASPNGNGRVDISWHRATLSNGTTLADHYYVSRYSGSTLDGFACGTNPSTPASLIPASAADGSGNFSCSDTGLTQAGPFTYTVTAIYRSWTAESVKSDPVTVSLVGPLDHFVLGAANTTVTAGSADSLTITAKDAAGNTITSYTGSHSLTFSGAGSIGSNNPTVTNSSGSATAFGSATALDFTAGVASVSGGSNGAMKLFKAETASIVVSDGSHSNGSGLPITVNPAAANKLAFTVQPTDTVSAQSITPAPAVTVQDQFGNKVSSSSASVTLAIGTNPAGGTLSGTKTVSATSGVATFSALTIDKAGSGYTLSASSSGLTGATSSTFNIAPGALAKLALSAGSVTPIAGAADNLTITAVDAAGNTVPSYTGSKALTFSGANIAPDGTTHPTVTNSSGSAINFGSITAIAFTNGVASVSGASNGVMKLFKAESASITVSDGTINNNPGLSVTVSAAAPSVFQFTNCSVNGVATANPCPATVNVGNNPGHLDAHASVLDTWRNTAKVTGSPLTVLLNSSAATTDYSITANPTIAVGASESGIFTVTHLVNASNSTVVSTTNASFTQASITVFK